MRAGVAAACHYNEDVRQRAPGSHVFAVEARRQPSREPSAPDLPVTKPAAAPFASRPGSDTGTVSRARLLWHGSRGVDTFVEPLYGRTIATPKEVMFGENDATVYWGRTHETNFITRITDAAKLLLETEEDAVEAAAEAAPVNDADTAPEDDNVSALFRVERNTRPGETVPVQAHDPALRALLPSRADADRLVDTYLRLFQAYYRVVHTASFLRDYARLWDADPAVAGAGPPTLLAQVLSMCATAMTIVPVAGPSPATIIEAVRLHLFQQDPRLQMTLGHLQATLLMLVAGDVHWIKIDRSWIAAGMLVRNAVSAGLHREPADFSRVAPFYAEMRRSLWYAVLEYDLQTCFAKGRTPGVRDGDYDCRPPSAVPDAVLAEDWAGSDGQTAKTKERGVLPSLPVCLARSLELRTRICGLVNGIQLDPDVYTRVLQLDAALRDFLADAAAAIAAAEPDRRNRVLLGILTRRPAIALHAPFVARSRHDPRYLYSRLVCVDHATAVLTEALSLLEGAQATASANFGIAAAAVADPFFAMLNNVCRCEIANSVLLLAHELLTQAYERRRGRQPASALLQQQQQQHLQQQQYLRLVEDAACATAAVGKPDIVSQRTCAWMQLAVELARAAVAGDEAVTAASMKEAIARSIEAYRASVQPLEPLDDSFFLRLDGFDNPADADMDSFLYLLSSGL